MKNNFAVHLLSYTNTNDSAHKYLFLQSIIKNNISHMWHLLERCVLVIITTTQLIQENLNLGSAQVQILLAACRRFAMIRTFDNGSD